MNNDPRTNVAQKILQNDWLTAGLRLLVPTLLTGGLTAFGWYESGMSNNMQNVMQRVDRLEALRTQGRIDLDRRIEHLEANDREDAVTNTEIARKIAMIEAGQVFVMRSLDRIEAAVGASGTTKH